MVYTSWDVGLCVIAIVCFPVWDVISFEIYLNFLIKPFSNITNKTLKNLSISKSEDFQLPEIVSDLGGRI